jgi:hypothetical protein
MTGQKRKVGAETQADGENIRTFTGWKLDLQRAVRADHKVRPGAASLFSALMDHVNIISRKAWPSEGMLALSLGVSTKTIRKYLQELIDAKWIVIDGRSNRGTTIYLVQDYRMNAVLDQLTIDIDRYREREAERQARRRAISKANVTEHGFQPTAGKSQNTGSYPSRSTGSHEHLHRTPSSQNSAEEEDNRYRRASDGW